MADETPAYPDQGAAYGPLSDMDIWHSAGGWLNRKDTQAARDRVAKMRPPPPMKEE